MDDHAIILPVAFLPPPGYFALLARGVAIIDLHEHFVKQTLRNRCTILTGNGPLDLIIPLEKGKNSKMAVNDVRISYAEDWQRKYRQAIVSAYKNSPYFEHYEPFFFALFMEKKAFLADYNLALTGWCLEALQADKNYMLSKSYPEAGESNDYRNGGIPSLSRPYKQAFAHKLPFVPGLSCIDLIFNKGPEAGGFLLDRE